MATILRMPEIAANATHARLETWLVEDGDTVTNGQVVAEIETEKAMVELSAEVDGMIRRLVPPGTDVGVGTPIGVIGTGTETEAADLLDQDSVTTDASPRPTASPSAASSSATPQTTSPERASMTPAPAPPARTKPSIAEPSASANLARKFVSPLARKRAKDLGIDLAEVMGRGPHGRVTVDDVLRHAAAAKEETSPAEVVGSEREYTDIPHSPMRRAIARRLTESKTNIPHFYLSARCRVDALLELRRDVNEVTPRRVSITDFIVLAAAKAFIAVPEANVIWTAEALRRFSTVDIALAVATDGGLLTPVLRDVARRSLLELSKATSEIVERAHAGRLRQQDLEGGSFSITNLGMYGTDSFSAILNPPQSGILAVGAAHQDTVVDNGALGIGTIMDVTLSVDHRAIDGVLAATWLAEFRRVVEKPVGILI